MSDNAIDKYIDAAKAAADVIARHGCSVVGLNIAAARTTANGEFLSDGKIALDVYAPLPTKELRREDQGSA